MQLNQECFPKENSVPTENPDFERMYQHLCTNVSDVEFLTNEILGSLNKFKPIISDVSPEKQEKEPCGIVETFSVKIAYMQRIVNKLEIANKTLKQLV